MSGTANRFHEVSGKAIGLGRLVEFIDRLFGNRQKLLVIFIFKCSLQLIDCICIADRYWDKLSCRWCSPLQIVAGAAGSALDPLLTFQ